MAFKVEKQDSVTVISVDGQLVVSNRQEFKQLVLDEVADGARIVIIDFSRTSYVDSSGLGALVSLGKRLRESGAELRLAGLNEDMVALFELTRLDSLFRLYSSSSEARSGAELS